MRAALLLAALLAPAAFAGCLGGDRLMPVLVAGSLGPAFARDLEPLFEANHPGVDVVVEAQGSRETAKKVTELGRRADLVAVADVDIIETLMRPRHAAWAARFASNAMVLAYGPGSEGADAIREITGDPAHEPWYEVLATRPRVLVGRSDPDTDPAGYRTLLMWKLADGHYGADVHDRLLARFPRPGVDTEAVLSAQLAVGDLDYIFTYRSLAVDHGHRFVELPDAIHLGNASRGGAYAAVAVTLTDGTVVRGAPITYGFTIPRNAPNPDLAVAFARLLVGDEGTRLLRERGLLVPPPGHGAAYVPGDQADAVPDGLRDALERGDA